MFAVRKGQSRSSWCTIPTTLSLVAIAQQPCWIVLTACWVGRPHPPFLLRPSSFFFLSLYSVHIYIYRYIDICVSVVPVCIEKLPLSYLLSAGIHPKLIPSLSVRFAHWQTRRTNGRANKSATLTCRSPSFRLFYLLNISFAN